MQNPLVNRQHIKEYLLVGLVSAILYTICVLMFLRSKNYEHLYYLFIGCILFMPVIFYYNMRLINRPYEGRRAASMLIAGHAATLAGVILSVIFSCICIWFFFSDNSLRSTDSMLHQATPWNPVNRPTSLLAMILVTAIIGNFGVGSFICVLVSYVIKKDQRKDRVEPLK